MVVCGQQVTVWDDAQQLTAHCNSTPLAALGAKRASRHATGSLYNIQQWVCVGVVAAPRTSASGRHGIPTWAMCHAQANNGVSMQCLAKEKRRSLTAGMLGDADMTLIERDAGGAS